jgi:superoxide dismutase, Cu-Zn family
MKAMSTGRLIQVAMGAAMLVGLGAGCTVGEAQKKAVAALESRSGSTVTGTGTFVANGGDVTLTLTVSGATPGIHAVHLHAVPDCSSADANSAMGHWNSAMMNHGLPEAPAHHIGDCGNFEVGADGTGTLIITKTEWSIGTGDPATDVIGHALISHAAPDDGVTQQPPGNAGARQACGVTVLQK